MPFDANPPSPAKLVDTRRADTKINIGMAIGVIIFFIFGAAALFFFALAAQ